VRFPNLHVGARDIEGLVLTIRSELLLLYTARGVRGFGDGFAVIVLPAYLTALGFDSIDIGIVATAALLGSSAVTLLFGLVAPRYDLRQMLIVGATLIVATGVIFPNVEQFAFILLVAFFGTINPQTGDSGILVPLEHAMLTRSITDQDRTRAFARYSLTGALATAAGALSAATPDLLFGFGIARLSAFQAMFYGYAVLGVLAALLYRRLPHASAMQKGASTPLGPSRHTVYRLAALFSLDSFAGGFVVQSLLALWLFQRFDLSLATASVFFFWTSVLTAFSYPVAARLSARIGLINTMVFTHIPSSLFLILAAFSPDLVLTMGLLLARSALAQMDVPARSSYVMAVVTPAERTAAASVTAVPRSLASALSPALSGWLLALPFTGLPLVICGALKITYDLGLLYAFRHVKPPEEQGD
jgi:MFS family permease